MDFACFWTEIFPMAEIAQTPGRIIELLREGARHSVTGEILAKDSDATCRVFIQKGRIAWARSTKIERKLLHYLLDCCPLDAMLLDEIVNECMEEKKHFAEVLVREDYATLSQVRTALSNQITDALRDLLTLDKPQIEFAPREHFAAYWEEITFELAQFDSVLAEYG
jgi:hypothetical protein